MLWKRKMAESSDGQEPIPEDIDDTNSSSVIPQVSVNINPRYNGKSDRTQRDKEIRYAGAALLALGLIFLYMTTLTSISIHTTLMPDGQGGVIPHTTTWIEYPYTSLTLPGILLFLVGLLLIAYSYPSLRE